MNSMDSMNSYYEYKKITMMLSDMDLIPLGDEKSDFYRWKKIIIYALDQSKLSEKEKKIIILSKIKGRFRKKSEDMFFDNMGKKSVRAYNKVFGDLEAMSVALDLEATYHNMTSINMERLESIEFLYCDEEDIQSEININKLKCLDIGRGIKKEDGPKEKRLIYLYMNGLQVSRKNVNV
ncbi:hypothetical protein PIROE2DRAFT_13947 [Piromyces sp. E2]|nr:hypothetical protein PIROE2DRAFT_13947 [Piromyces sp. E2]|eukprot:OUM60329.1 hypothetical protein PIROE2DRAFT_13947 [Piromyces sp. E2]